jgi:UDP-2,4-diacetamido-2,4,6-trideoxy-beta-L-altropyranose hydrolase
MKIAILADNICTSGLGHLNRCVAVAQAVEIEHGLKPVFVSDDKFSTQWLEKKNFPARNSLTGNWDLIILDSYLKNDFEINSIRKCSNSFVVFDDLGKPPMHTDILINSGMSAVDIDYDCYLPRKVLIGPSFHPLRSEFVNVKSEKKTNVVLDDVLITLGGITSQLYMVRIIDLVRKNFFFSNLHVIISPLFSDDIKNKYKKDLKLFFYYSPDNVSEIFKDVDLAISGGGQTLFELAFFGIPTLAIELAFNQRPNILAFEKLGALFNVGSILEYDFDDRFTNVCLQIIKDKNKLTKVSDAAMTIIDGKGAYRIANNIINEKFV